MALSEKAVEGVETAPQRITGRAIGIGVFMAVLVIVWNTYVEYIAHTARMNITHFPLALFVPYVVLTLGNAMLRRRGVAWVLTSAEIWTILAMGLVGAAVPAFGLTGYLLGMIAMPYYMATPENQWGAYFHEYLPDWLIPTNEGGAMQYLFEGLPSPDMPIPWGVWVMPLFGWMAFIGAIVVACLALAVLLRKQWAEHERLGYPLLHAAGDLAEAESRVPLLKNKFFIIGAAIPFSILAWNIIGYFSPGFPRISLGPGWMPMGQFFPRIHVNWNFYTIGFAYFANVEVLFSIWVFYLFYCIQIMFYRRVGIHLSGRGDSGDATTSLQAGGAFLALVVWGLWMARSHIRDVFTKAFKPGSEIDDSQEMMSYRTCAFGLILSTIFLVFWMNAIGVSWLVAIALTLGIYITYIGTARVIAETGVVYFSMPMTGNGLLPFLFGGPGGFDGRTQTALRLVDAVRSQNQGMFMSPFVHAARIGDMVGGNRRLLVLGIALTLIFGLGSAIAYSLYLGYTYGAFNFNDFPFTRYPPGTYNGLVGALRGEDTWENERYFFLLLGVGIFALMNMLRYRFAWWPLAPIGMVVPPTSAVHSMFSIFLAWGMKALILKIGGVEAYRRFRPLFLGFLVGHALGVLLSFIVDQIWFPGQGHGTHSW